MTMPEMHARYFNQLVYDEGERSVTKRSTDERKLTDEICWYLDLPSRCKSLIPAIYDYSLEPGNVFVTMEYIPWPTLTDSYLTVEGSSQLLEWEKVFEDLREVVRQFTAYSREPDITSYETMYMTKTHQRLGQFIRSSEWASAMLERGFQEINGRRLPCPSLVLERERAAIDRLLYEGRFQIIHGDYCFPNILYDHDSRSIKLIDPRGSFGAPGLFGDVRYDLAKIRHSLSGFDNIVRDRFTVSLSGQSIALSLADNLAQRALRQMWDRCLDKRLAEVRLIESLLFLSMLPLHSDRPDRQMAMYALGTLLLCSCLYD
ncbi:hypothetical protein LOK74_08200 [Brevibacillus humidisoli]|uniref:hypothetical protein n=1 Tax=Brevibacillus humidisoli TaxID=2895522 RepID=UPI001E54CFED|nr:hypothetical protein [Brevibacillus humidisoli]UFJ42455.1 hypothetical protein LOK74_08200 [Brevibacillus humidisoli]